MLDGRYLYAIAVETGTRFNLCPADICQSEDGTPADASCPVEAPKQGLEVVADAPRVVGFDPFVRLVDFLERERR